MERLVWRLVLLNECVIQWFEIRMESSSGIKQIVKSRYNNESIVT